MTNIASNVPAPPPVWQTRFARFGLFSNGLVHFLVGLLAFMAAFKLGRNRSSEVDQQGAFRFVLEQPFGKVILIMVAVGLACYSLYRLTQAIKDTENKGGNAKGIGRRIGYLLSSLIYGGFAFAAFRLSLAGRDKDMADDRESMARTLMEQPLGIWLLGLIGAGVAAAGFYQIYKGLSNKYKKKLSGARLKHGTEAMLIRAGKLGFIARGIVWIVTGYFFIRGALEANPSETGGMSEAFQFLQGTFGPILMGAVALGLICYGGFMFMRARYEPIRTA